MAEPKSIAERFWAKVERRGPDECWSWLGSHDRFGRGDFYWSREVEKVKAPRASWWLTYGEAPPRELSVCHSCDNAENVIERAEEWRENTPEDSAGWYEDKLFDGGSEATVRLQCLLQEAAEKWLAEFPGAAAHIWESRHPRRVLRDDYAAPGEDRRHGSSGPPSWCGLCADEGWTPGCDETEYLPHSSEGRKLRDAITKSAAPGQGE